MSSLMALGLFACNRTPREFRIDVNIVGGKLEKRDLYVPASTQVAITLRNRDTGAAAIEHDFVLVQAGSVESPKPADILAQSPRVAPGKSSTFRFPAPSSGNYEFFCSGPGHKPTPAGAPSTVMRGKFIVQ